MKKTLAILAFVLMYTACSDDTTSFLYVLKNKSSHKVVVKVYYSNYIQSTFSVEANSYYEQEYSWDNSFCLIDRYTDSTEIVFDDNKTLTFYRDSLEQKNSIYNRADYSMVGTDEKLKVFYYTLTDADYTAAKSKK